MSLLFKTANEWAGDVPSHNHGQSSVDPVQWQSKEELYVCDYAVQSDLARVETAEKGSQDNGDTVTCQLTGQHLLQLGFLCPSSHETFPSTFNPWSFKEPNQVSVSNSVLLQTFLLRLWTRYLKKNWSTTQRTSIHTFKIPNHRKPDQSTKPTTTHTSPTVHPNLSLLCFSSTFSPKLGTRYYPILASKYAFTG